MARLTEPFPTEEKNKTKVEASFKIRILRHLEAPGKTDRDKTVETKLC